MSGANENTPLVVGGGANDSLDQYLQRILNCRIESRLLPATSQASSVQVEGNLPPAAPLDGIPGPGECDIEPLKWDEEVRAFYQEVIQNLIKAGSPVATSNDDPGTHPWPRVAAAFIGDFKWKEKVLLSILLLFGVALIGAEIFFLRNNVRRTSLTHPWEWPDYTLLSLRVSTTAWTIGSAAFIFLAGKRYMRPKRRRYLSLALRNNTIALTAMGIYVVSTFLIVMVLGIHNNLPPSFVFAHAFCGSLAKGAVYLVIILIIGSFHGVLDEFTFQDYLVALYPSIQPDDLAKLKHRVDSQRALYARGFWFAAFFGIVLFCGGETYLACNFRSVYDDLRLELVESVAGSSTGQVAPQGTLDAVNLFLTLEAFPAVSILTLVAIGLWRMNSQGNKWHDMSQAQKDAKLKARLIDAAKEHARRKVKLQTEAAAAAAAMEEGRAPAILARAAGDSVGSSHSRQT